LRPPGHTLLYGALFLGLCAFGLSLGTWGKISPGVAPTVMAVAFSYLAILASSCKEVGAIGRLLSKLGVCSYSMYLVHFAVIDLSRFVLWHLRLNHQTAGFLFLASVFACVVGVSFCVAMATRQLIELPSINLGRRLSMRLLRIDDQSASAQVSPL